MTIFRSCYTSTACDCLPSHSIFLQCLSLWPKSIKASLQRLQFWTSVAQCLILPHLPRPPEAQVKLHFSCLSLRAHSHTICHPHYTKQWLIHILQIPHMCGIHNHRVAPYKQQVSNSSNLMRSTLLSSVCDLSNAWQVHVSLAFASS